MRIPFAHALSIGTDIIRLSRLSKSPHTFGKLVLRILQPLEQQIFNKRFPQSSPDASPRNNITENKRREWLGGRWAAKEAAKKAWGASLLSFKDLRVEAEPDGNVVVVCALLPEGEFDDQVAKVSISHDSAYAIATVLASPLSESIVSELRRRRAEAERSVTPQTPGSDETAT